MIKKILVVLGLCVAALGFANSQNQADQDIAKKVHEKIGPGWFSSGYDEVKVDVRNGVVTLSGSVKTEDDKAKVERDVRNISGVTQLQSNIHVENGNQSDMNHKESKEPRKYPQDTFGTSADEQLNKKIRDNVSNGWLWDSYKGVFLNTNNGTVTLEGNVKDERDQQKLMSEIQKVSGVKSVKSNLRIQSQDNNRR